MKRTRIFTMILLLVVAIAWLTFAWFGWTPPRSNKPSALPYPEPQATIPAPAPITPYPQRIAMAPADVTGLAPVPSNPMAAAIGSAKVPPEREIGLVLELFQFYRREFGAFPAGQTNAQFMNALRGSNPGKLPVFPLDHPRLDAGGNLLDPWGRPYIFHPVSRDRLEVRSKGPDGEIFSGDDLVAPR